MIDTTDLDSYYPGYDDYCEPKEEINPDDDPRIEESIDEAIIERLEKRRVKKMAYIKREKYTISSDGELRKELLNVLLEKGIPSGKAKQLVYYPVPMSLIRWSRYLDPNECEMYLEPYNENDENQEDFGF